MCPCDVGAPTACVLQVNNLLAKTLQMQQKVLQSQETAISKALASQSPQGTTVQTSSQATQPVTTPTTSVQPSKPVTSTVAVTSQTSIPPVQDLPSQAVPVPVTIPVTVPVTVPVLLAAGETSEAGPASSSPSQAGPTTSAAGKSPVFIHIISKSYLAVSTEVVKHVDACRHSTYTYCMCTCKTPSKVSFNIHYVCTLYVSILFLTCTYITV